MKDIKGRPLQPSVHSSMVSLLEGSEALLHLLAGCDSADKGVKGLRTAIKQVGPLYRSLSWSWLAVAFVGWGSLTNRGKGGKVAAVPLTIQI